MSSNKKAARVQAPRKEKRTPAQRMAAGIAIALAVLMSLSLLVSILPVHAATTQDTINQLKNQLNQLNRKKDKINGELSALSSDINTMGKQIKYLDEQIAVYEEELELNTFLLETMDELLAEKDAELQKADAEAEAQYERLKSRIRLMVENGKNSYLSALLSAEDFADFLSRYAIVTQISTRDQKLYEDMQQTVETVNAQHEELVLLREEQANYNAAMELLKDQLQSQKDYRNQQLVTLQHDKVDAQQLYANIAKEEEELSAAIRKAVADLADSTKYEEGDFHWPLPLTSTNLVVTCKFGMRKHPITGKYKLHSGVDLRAYTGTNVYAAKGGTVITSSYSNGYGNYIVINHGGGVATLYGHLDKRLVKAGDKVKVGQRIGKSGNTGYSTAPHLHFEIIVDGEHTDPLKSFPNVPYTFKR